MVKMNNIPEWQYPLYEAVDKVVYKKLVGLSQKRDQIKVIGNRQQTNQLLKLLVVSQKLKDYRRFRGIVLANMETTALDTPTIFNQAGSIKVPKGVDRTWAAFFQDERLCKLIDKLAAKKVVFVGSSKDIVEFVIRFILSQMLTDWRGPLIAVIQKCLDSQQTSLKSLNSLLKTWDYTGVFKPRS